MPVSHEAGLSASAIGILGACGGLLGLGLASGYALRGLMRSAGGPGPAASPESPSSSQAAPGSMTGAATAADMSTYAELFARHTELRRTVRLIPGGVRALTETGDPALAAQLQAHVASMYGHMARGTEVTCMSGSLPTLFRDARARVPARGTGRGCCAATASCGPPQRQHPSPCRPRPAPAIRAACNPCGGGPLEQAERQDTGN